MLDNLDYLAARAGARSLVLRVTLPLIVDTLAETRQMHAPVLPRAAFIYARSGAAFALAGRLARCIGRIRRSGRGSLAARTCWACGNRYSASYLPIHKFSRPHLPTTSAYCQPSDWRGGGGEICIGSVNAKMQLLVWRRDSGLPSQRAPSHVPMKRARTSPDSASIR